MQVINFESIKVVSSSTLTTFNKLELNEVVKKAMEDKYIGTSVEWWEKVDKQVILYNNKVIGFFCPRHTTLESFTHPGEKQVFSKSGTVFILPNYRGYRISLYVLSNWCKENIPCLAYIDDINTSSISVFTKLGYVPYTEEITNKYTGNIGRFYILEDTQVINNLQF